jgi:hypothetical protein
MMGDAMNTEWKVRHASIAVSVTLTALAACSGLPNEGRQASRPEPLLFIDCFHTRERTCVGLYLDDGELVGGFRGVEGMVWPITIRERLSEFRYRVDSRIGTLGKFFPTEWAARAANPRGSQQFSTPVRWRRPFGRGAVSGSGGPRTHVSSHRGPREVGLRAQRGGIRLRHDRGSRWDLEIKVGSKFDWRLRYSMRESYQDWTYSGEAVSPATLTKWVDGSWP